MKKEIKTQSAVGLSITIKRKPTTSTGGKRIYKEIILKVEKLPGKFKVFLKMESGMIEGPFYIKKIPVLF